MTFVSTTAKHQSQKFEESSFLTSYAYYVRAPLVSTFINPYHSVTLSVCVREYDSNVAVTVVFLILRVTASPITTPRRRVHREIDNRAKALGNQLGSLLREESPCFQMRKSVKLYPQTWKLYQKL